MGFVNTVKGGANLTHPHISPGWIIGAIVAIFLLIAVYVISKWGFNKVAAPISNVVSGSASTNAATTGNMNTDSSGWIY
jgi:hypothetical protein